MKSKAVVTITNNEDYVRMRIFDGELKPDEGAAEVIRLGYAQELSALRLENMRLRALLKEGT